MISSVCFLKKGVAKSSPEKYEMTTEEYEMIMKKAEVEIKDAKENIEKIKEESGNDPDLAEYNLDTYDDEDVVDQSGLVDGDDDEGAGGLFSNIKGLSYYAGNEEDPYITLKEDDDEEKEENEDLEIRPSDYLILAAKTEDDISNIEVNVYEEDDDNLYVHHDIMLPSFPLCLEWIGHPFSDNNACGNYMAVGTFEPEIEVWNLDLIDSVYPKVILGDGAGAGVKSKKSSKKSSKNSSLVHTDAVMTLSWNMNHSNVLASGSADTTIKLWDLNNGSACVASFDHHSDKVQSIQWNPKQSTMLASGSYDKTVSIFDSNDASKKSRKVWTVAADVECIKWNPFDSNYFMVSLESGDVLYYDIRADSKAVFTLNAHMNKAVTCIDWNPLIPGIFLTGSTDKTVKIWDLNDNSPSCIHSTDLKAGKVFSAGFSKDSPYLVCAGGTKASLKVWNMTDNGSVRSLLMKKVKQIPALSSVIPATSTGAKRKEVVGVSEEAESDDDKNGKDAEMQLD